MNPRYERWRWQTFGITWLIYASFYLTRQAFGVAKVVWPADSRIDFARSQYGIIDSTWLALYAAGQFVFGPLGDRLGPRIILLFGLSLSVAAAVASGFSTTLWAFIACATVQGIAQSTGWSNVSKTMSNWFSLRERGRVIGLWCTHYTIGAAIALPFGGWMMAHYGHLQASPAGVVDSIPFWPAAFWGPAAVLAVVTVLSWLLLVNRPEDVGLPSIEKYHGEPESLLVDEDKKHIAPEGSWVLVGEVLRSPPIWMLAIAYFSIKLTRYSFYAWGPKYVSEHLGEGAIKSTLVAAAMPIGGLVGVIVSGFISDKLFQSRRAPVIVLSLLLTIAVMMLALVSIPSMWMLAGFFFLVGLFLFGPDSMISATAAMDFGTKRGAGTAVGFINGIGSLGGVLGGWLPGKITTETNWSPLFIVFIVGLAFSAVIVTPLWRTKPPET